MLVQKITALSFPSFVRDKPWAVVLLDAKWDNCHSQIMARMERAARELEAVNFGEIDINDERELASCFPIFNVPTVAYFQNGELVAAITSSTQDVSR